MHHRVMEFVCPHCETSNACVENVPNDVMCAGCDEPLGWDDLPADEIELLWQGWEGKGWGRVRHVFTDPHFSVSDLLVKAGERCSLHFHEDRGNTFQVIDAQIIVEEFGSALDMSQPMWEDNIGRIFRAPSDTPVKATLLYPGMCCTCPAMSWHRFRVIRPGRVIELYFGDDVRLDDIVRFDVGGPDV